MTHPNTSARKLILAIAASSVLASGCSKKNDAKEAVSKAGHQFQTIAVGDPTLADEFSKKVYNEAAAATTEFAGTDGSFGEAAAVTLALSKLGLATLAGGEASDAETKSIHQSRIIRGHLSEWIAMNAVALATTDLDVTEDKKALQDLIGLRTSDVTQYTKLMNSLQAEITGFQATIDDLNAKSVTERNESARYELQMTSVSATEAAQLAERVREHSLRADGFELESVRLQGRVGQLLPGAHEVELQVQMAKDQIDLLHMSIDELDQRVRDTKQDSAQARANAANAQTALSGLVDALESFRQDTATPANEKVVSTLRQSLSAARGASKTAKVSGTLAKASAQEHLARALSRQARGEAEMAMLFGTIEASGISGNWTSRGAPYATRRDELIEEANQAFQDAASSLRSTRTRGEAGEALEAAAVRLDLLGGVEPEPEYIEEFEDEDFEDYDETEDDAEFVDETDTETETEIIDDDG